MHYRGHGYTNAAGTQFTLRDAAILFFQQRGQCRICKPGSRCIDLRPNAPFDSRACADDNHKKSRKVRALLCDMCNKALGHLKESRGGAGRATTYLHDEGNYESDDDNSDA